MLVDTSVWIDFFNARDSAEVRLLVAAIADGEPIEIPGIVLVEILSGLRSDAEAARIAQSRSRRLPRSRPDFLGVSIARVHDPFDR